MTSVVMVTASKRTPSASAGGVAVTLASSVAARAASKSPRPTRSMSSGAARVGTS